MGIRWSLVGFCMFTSEQYKSVGSILDFVSKGVGHCRFPLDLINMSLYGLARQLKYKYHAFMPIDLTKCLSPKVHSTVRSSRCIINS